MDKIIKLLPTVIGVVTGQDATVEVPIGRRVHVIWLEGTVKKTGVAPALSDIMGLIKVKINGKPQRQMTATELVELNRLNGEAYRLRWQQSTDDGVTYGALGTPTLAAGNTARFQVPIYFAEPWREEYAAQVYGAIPTAWPNGSKLQSLTVEVAIPSVANTSLHSLKAWVESDKALGMMNGDQPLLQLTKWLRPSTQYSAAGPLDITTFPRRDFVASIHLFSQTADPITDVEVIVDNDEKRKVTKYQNDAALIGREVNPDAISANRLDLIFDYDDRPDSALNLNGVLDFLVKPTLASAAAATKSITAIIQAFGPPD